MDTNLYMQPKQVRKGAGEILEQRAELLRILSSLDEIVGKLPGVWQDPARVKFTNEYNNMRPEFDKFCEILKFFAERASEHANDVEKVSQIL